MDAEQEVDAAGERDGRRVVGAGYREPGGPVWRRDRPIPASWTRDVPLGTLPDDYVARPVRARPIAFGRLVVVALLVLFLVAMVVALVATAVVGESVPADMALRFVFGAVIQFLGWWTVIHLIRDR
ncbi:hypothetical protein [Demequina lutea]|uniref:Uncharacterized protein n=1 Tax=Demequina lutea TaxID=431489 RepID=A0A7Y9ZCC2_9MICO|nr:hypothetical protein [Demequina lutea]NYI42260.1 hypothetical protein [Demequina lutea]